MNPRRFELALERLPSAQWERFELLSSVFLATDYPNLRTVASPAGDQGRDAFLFQEQDDPTVLIQYSVAEDWRAKIRETARRLNETFPDTRVLVYMSNRLIGAAADELRDEIRRERRLFLDVRDRTWFVERVNSSVEREAAAEELAIAVVDPYLASEGIIETKGQALGSLDLQTAFVYLALQWEDDSREKGLTKIAFEALVRAALRDTDSDHRMTREEIKDRVHTLLPAHRREDLAVYVDTAIGRLTKKVLRHWQKPDEFCLTFAERQRLATQLTELEHNDRLLDEILTERVEVLSRLLQIETDSEPAAIVKCVRAIIEKILLARGEAFVRAVDDGRLGDLPLSKLADAAITELASSDGSNLDANALTIAKTTAIDVLTEPPGEGQAYLRSLAESYTLFAFLRETPNVQSVVVKMFSGGELWLDTSVVLPLFAEELLDPHHRNFTNIISAAREAGLRLYVTRGVLEEIEAHMRLSLTYSRWDSSREAWRGSVPFLYGAFALTGRSRTAFASWLENFRGDRRPVDDVAVYLSSVFGITVQDLADEADRVPSEIGTAVRDVWQRIHERRRAGDTGGDPLTALMLADHDAENYLGVIGRRNQEANSAFGYTTWWLTLDGGAHSITRKLQVFHGVRGLMSPAISPDFMLTYLTLGPIRSRLARSTEMSLPLVAELTALGLPPDLFAAADAIRDEMADLPEHVVRRRVRDALDAGRLQLGSVAGAGLDAVIERIRATYRQATSARR